MTATAFVRSETRRAVRNKRAFVFTIVTPALLFLFLGSTGGDYRPYGLSPAAFYMVSMATFGGLNGVFATGGRIALERATGWNRQLRLTALTGRQYVLGKVTTGFAVAVPTLLVICVLAAATGRVHLGAGRWLAVAGSILVALTPIAALGVWVGYIAKSDSIQTITGLTTTVLSLFGGLWFAFDGWLRQVSEALPSYWISQSGRSALRGSWVGWHGLAVLAAWTVVCTALAARAYRRDTERA